MKWFKSCFIIVSIFQLSAVRGQYTETINELSVWLTESGLSPSLSVHDIIPKEGFDLLRLQLHPNDPDIAVQVWNTLKEDFEKSNSFTISEYLFYEYLHTVKKNPSDLAIQIRENYNENETACAELLIYFDKESLDVKTVKNFCKSLPETSFEFDLPEINAGRVDMDLRQFRQSRHQTYLSIIDFTRELYRKGGLNGTAPVTANANSYFRGQENLMIEIPGMKKEVLTDLDENWFCQVLQWLRHDDSACDFSAWEYIRLEFSYTVPEENTARLSCMIEGRYSSGIYDEVIWDKANNMEPDLAPYLKPYLDRYMQQLYKYLTE